MVGYVLLSDRTNLIIEQFVANRRVITTFDVIIPTHYLETHSIKLLSRTAQKLFLSRFWEKPFIIYFFRYECM